MPNIKKWSHVQIDLADALTGAKTSEQIKHAYTKVLTHAYGVFVGTNDAAEVLGYANRRCLMAAISRGTVDLGFVRHGRTNAVLSSELACHLIKLHTAALAKKGSRRG